MNKLSKIAASVPVDQVAQRVVQKGVHFVPLAKHSTYAHSDVPLPVWGRIPVAARKNPSFIDFSGAKFGRFTVVGLSEQVMGGWVVKCDCGAYEIRRKKAIQNPLNKNDKCYICRYEEHLRDPDRPKVPKWTRQEAI